MTASSAASAGSCLPTFNSVTATPTALCASVSDALTSAEVGDVGEVGAAGVAGGVAAGNSFSATLGAKFLMAFSSKLPIPIWRASYCDFSA